MIRLCFPLLMNGFHFTRKSYLKESEDEASVTLLYNLTALLGQMEKNEVQHSSVQDA